jgi:Leucine-rich repeat (LRR) protein
MSFDRYFQGKKLSITDGTLQQINDSELDKIFEHAFFNNITDIDLSKNNLTELSIDLLVSIGCIKTVQSLNLKNNQLSTLPGLLTNITKLKELDLQGNPLISPPPDVVIEGTEAVLQYLKEPIGYDELVRIFHEAAEQNVEVIDLSGRKIEELPPEIGKLVNLKELHLCSNELTSLPAEFFQLENLSILDLSNNNLNMSPDDFFCFERTQNLRL